MTLNPLADDADVVAAGRLGYETFCQHCHGPGAFGNSSLTEAFPRPPSLQSSKVREWPDGRIYHVVTMGQNAMPGHEGQTIRQERWEIVRYVRARQSSPNVPHTDEP